jgi:hypothetical protein
MSDNTCRLSTAVHLTASLRCLIYTKMENAMTEYEWRNSCGLFQGTIRYDVPTAMNSKATANWDVKMSR